MTQTESTKTVSVNPKKHYFINLLRQNKKFIILCFVMHLLGLPFILFMDILNQDDSFSIIISVICLIIALFAGVPIALNNFRHLYNKQYVDMELSLPLTSKDRFFTGYLSGLAAYILPFAITEILSYILLFIDIAVWRSKDVDNFIFNTTLYTTEEILEFVTFLIIGGMLLMILFYTFYIFAMCFCGEKFETVFYGLGANFCIPVLFLCAYFIVENSNYGINLSLTDNSFFSLAFFMTSPIGYGTNLAVILTNLVDSNGVKDISFSSIYSFSRYIVSIIILTLVFLGLAYLVYRKRTAEQTGKSFAVKGFYYVITTCLCIAIIMLFNGTVSYNNIFASFILSAVCYIILDSISNRGIKKLGKSVVKFLITFIASYAIIFISQHTGFFGAAYYTPSVNSIQSIEMEYFDNEKKYYNKDLIYENDESKKLITDFQKDTIKLYKEKIKTRLNNDDTVKIKYTLKSGREVTRDYYLFADTAHFINELYLSDETKENLKNTFKEQIETSKKITVYSGNTSQTVEMYDGLKSKLISCYEKDIDSLTYDEYAKSDITLYENKTYSIDVNACDFYFDSTYENVTNIVSYYIGLESDAESSIYNYLSDSFGYITIYKAKGNGSLSIEQLADNNELYESKCFIYSDEESYNSNYYYDYEEADGTNVTKHFATDLSEEDLITIMEMISESKPMYIPDDTCYIISMNGLYGYIPDSFMSFIEDKLM